MAMGVLATRVCAQLSIVVRCLRKALKEKCRAPLCFSADKCWPSLLLHNGLSKEMSKSSVASSHAAHLLTALTLFHSILISAHFLRVCPFSL